MNQHREPASPLQVANRAIEDLATAIAAQRDAPDPADGEFVGYGAVMVGALHGLNDLAAMLARRVQHYGDERLLGDDTGGAPRDRLELAAAHLQQLRTVLALAERHANGYSSEIAHIAVAVDPNATPDGDTH